MLWRSVLALPLVVVLIPMCMADALGDALSQLPACGLQCILKAVPESACHVVTNTTCLCTNRGLYSAVQACITTTCLPEEAIAVARVQSTVCRFPYRSRKNDLLAPLSAEILAVLCIPLRLYSRWYTMTRFEVDDYIMMVVGPIFLVFTVVGHTAAALAFGVDVWNVASHDITLASKLFYVDESLYLAILCLTKLSILCFYLRIFPQSTFRRATFLVIAWVVLSTLVLLGLQIFQCVPVPYVWEGWKGTFGPHRCLDMRGVAYAAAGTGIAQDVAVLALPVPRILALNAAWRIKAGVLLMFSLGVFMLATSCVRLRFLVLFGGSRNATWDYTDVMIWSGLEAAVSVIVTSLPAIRVLLSRLMPAWFGSADRGESNELSWPGWGKAGVGGGGCGRGEPGGGGRAEGRGFFGGEGSPHQLRSQPSEGGGFGASGGDRTYRVMGRSRSKSSGGSQLELGHKLHEGVHAEIGVGDSASHRGSMAGEGKIEDPWAEKPRQRALESRG